MALASTTLSGAVGVNDDTIRVAAATGFAVGNLIQVDGELMLQTAAPVGTTIAVKRGMEGTFNQAHPTSAVVATGLATDFARPGPGKITAYGPAAGGASSVAASYSASGAIDATKEGVHLLHGAGALAMTLAAPTQGQTGQLITIASTGAGAHTVTGAGGFGGGGIGTDVATFPAYSSSLTVIAINGKWVVQAAGPGVVLA
jgi:hypothetical protein